MQQLGQGGQRRVHNVLLQRPGGQQRVHIQPIQPPGQLLHGCRVGHAVHKHHRHPGVALAAYAALDQLQLGGADPPPHQRGVDPQRLHKGVLGPLQGFFQGGLADASGVGGTHLKAHRLPDLVQDHRAVAVGQIIHHLVHGLPLLGGVVIGCPQQDQLQALLLVGHVAAPAQLGQGSNNVLRHRRAGDHPIQPAYLQADLFLQAEQYFPRFKIAAALENIIQPLGGKEAFVFRLLLLMEAPAQITCVVVHIV